MTLPLGIRRQAGQSRRENAGDLIVLHLYGSYRDMGRQQVELLGPIARDTYDMHRADWARLIGGFGRLAKMADGVLPRLWMTLGPRYDDSCIYQEIIGFGDALHVARSSAWRGVFGTLGGATTTFAATRAATADGHAILAKNSDWPDRYGRRPQMVTHYNPDNGDFRHVVAGWPLTPLSPAGVNEAGLAMGLNFFNATQVLALTARPRWPYRRILQKAATVAEAVRIITESPNRGMSGFISLADAEGDIALIECVPGDSEVFHADVDWFAQSNHARTEKMQKYDRGRSLDSCIRLPAMETAVRQRLGRINPQVASEILRDRSNTEFANESCIANPSAFHSVVMHPASRTLWHSTVSQPLAPFGELAAFSANEAAAPAPPLPADARYGTPAMEHERTVVADIRRAIRLDDEGATQEALTILDRFAESGEPLVEPHRLSWARARCRWKLSELQDADALLAALDGDAVPFDVRINAVVARAVVADRLGDRGRAIGLYQRGQALFAEQPQYNDGLVAFLHRRVAAGLQAPLTSGPFPQTPALQRVPG